MDQQRSIPISRRAVLAGGTALATGALASPAIVRAQPAPVKVGLIHPVTGFVAYNGQQSRLGATMAIDDVNKAGGVKAMGGAKLEALLGDSQSKVEVGVSEVEKMHEQGVAAYIGCFQSPVGIAASQAAAKYNTPFLIDVGASDLLVTRGLKNVFRLKPGFGVCVDQGMAALDTLNKGANNVAKSAVIVHESGEFGTGTAKLLSGKLPSIGIQVKEVISHDNPTRNFDNIALRIRSVAPDLVMMSNYQNEYVLLARTLFQQKVNLAGFYSFLGGGFNYKFVKEMPDVSQYMMDTNHWFNPKSEKAQALKKRVEATKVLFTYELYLSYSVVMLLADALEHAGSADNEKLLAALSASTFKAELMPYGPTRFVNGQNQGGRAMTLQSLKGDIEVIAPAEFASAKAVFPRPKFT
ncbi:ABC transporter substrate-binding protein [Enhydrobacter sp.]|jgi:branched-chain amino acid transport system substrate-binding protein|uniref:ABC transporter substrate-binding protein n=1 Tax=Enhydrobacter sp. TaxID=1894999 RepID=UPI00260E4146|nr:ABC transporter substrate-binding protein [Enhydrobacter sp.]WIM10682.1 MAG: ABC transporter, substrate-binding protein (cluster 4, leucine/isoleucine/valine/benzoate) [Enhydrobacter sp.]